MIKIFINNEPKELPEQLALDQLILLDNVIGIATFAIAVNENFIPKANYAETRLNDGDRVEILSPMQGG